MHAMQVACSKVRKDSSEMQILDETVKTAVTDRLQRVEAHLDGDVAFFYGSIDVSVMCVFRDFVERMSDARS